MKVSVFFIMCLTLIGILHAKALRLRRYALRDENMLWPNATVPFNIDGALRSFERLVIKKAMKDIESVSCVRFKRHSGENGYVDIVKGSEPDCSSDLGYTGSRQTIILTAGCFMHETVLHELFHTLGFEHEHSRSDRDQYIRINKDNIEPENLLSFDKRSPDKFTSFGLPYDLYSIMHYHDREFAIFGRKSIEPIRGPPFIGRVTVMSSLDVIKLNKLYRC